MQDGWPLVLENANLAREKFHDALFILGGEHGTARPDMSLKNSPFDIVVYGEGEQTLLNIVKAFDLEDSWRGLTGIYHKLGDRVVKNPMTKRELDIDSLPYPDWDSWSIRDYIDHNQVTGINLGRTIPFLASRGCPYNCKFCSNESMWTKRYIMREAKGIVDEMQFLKEKYDLDGFSFMDLTFIVNRNKTKEFARELLKRNLNIVRHERTLYKVCVTAQKMRAGPSEPACRSRLQTT